MTKMKHIHTGPCLLRTSTGVTTIRAYVLHPLLGQEWLPDYSIFASDLVSIFLEEGHDKPALYHSGAAFHSLKTLSHLAGLAASLHALARNPSPAAQFSTQRQMNNSVDYFMEAYREISDFSDQGYYRAGATKHHWEVSDPVRLIIRGQIKAGQLRPA